MHRNHGIYLLRYMKRNHGMDLRYMQRNHGIDLLRYMQHNHSIDLLRTIHRKENRRIFTININMSSSFFKSRWNFSRTSFPTDNNKSAKSRGFYLKRHSNLSLFSCVNNFPFINVALYKKNIV